MSLQNGSISVLYALFFCPLAKKTLPNQKADYRALKSSRENSTIELIYFSLWMRRAVFTVVTMTVHEIYMAHFQVLQVRNNSLLFKKVYRKGNTEGMVILVRFFVIQINSSNSEWKYIYENSDVNAEIFWEKVLNEQYVHGFLPVGTDMKFRLHFSMESSAKRQNVFLQKAAQ